MNPSTWTDQQQRAITARGAFGRALGGHGCGKTFVLTERFLAELEPGGGLAPPHLSQLVAITFTERAAREMQRPDPRSLPRALARAVQRSRPATGSHLLRELDSARISTIHAFCGGLLRAHAVEAGIDPRFRVLDGAQAGTLLFELSDEVLRDRLAAARRGGAGVGDTVRAGSASRHDRPAAGRAGRRSTGRCGVTRRRRAWSARWEAFWRRDTVPRDLAADQRVGRRQTVLDLCDALSAAPAKMRKRCDFLLDRLPKLRGERAAGGRPGRRSAKRPRCKEAGRRRHWVSEAVYERFRDAAKELREAIDGVQRRMQFDPAAARPRRGIGPANCSAWPPTWPGTYDERKRELGVLDFDDLLIRARNLLVGPEQARLRQRLAAQTRLLLVDEFQDTDRSQVEMVKALCDNEHLRGKLFFVGDFKQSIYRFRGAEPHVFRELRERDPRGGTAVALGQLSQPAGGARFRQRAVRRGTGARLRAAASASSADWPHAGGRVPVGSGRCSCRNDGQGELAAMPSPYLSRGTIRLRGGDPLAPGDMSGRASGSVARPIGSPGESAPCSTRARRSSGMRKRPRPASRRSEPVRPGDMALLFRA